jgi:hypothetical protein
VSRWKSLTTILSPWAEDFEACAEITKRVDGQPPEFFAARVLGEDLGTLKRFTGTDPLQKPGFLLVAEIGLLMVFRLRLVT